MARVLIVGGGCRGRRLAGDLVADGHAARITTRSPARRAAIESCGAECFVGDPDRLATLTGALEHVTIVCWLLASAAGSRGHLRELRSSRVQRFLERTVDTSVRGVLYEASGAGADGGREPFEGERAVRAIAERNAIPVAIVTADPSDADAWAAETRTAIGGLLGAARPAPPT